MTLVEVIRRLPLFGRLLLAFGLLVLLIVILSNRQLIENLTHLLQAFPPIIWIPINTTTKRPENQKPIIDSKPQTDKL